MKCRWLVGSNGNATAQQQQETTNAKDACYSTSHRSHRFPLCSTGNRLPEILMLLLTHEQAVSSHILSLPFQPSLLQNAQTQVYLPFPLLHYPLIA